MSDKLYYLGTGTEFVKAQCKKYKTIEGALKAAAKDESLVVWDEDGNCIGSLADDIPVNVLDAGVNESETEKVSTERTDIQKIDSEVADIGENNRKEDKGANIPPVTEKGQKEENTALENKEEKSDITKVTEVKGTVIATVICDGTLNLRRSASFTVENICGRASKSQKYQVRAVHQLGGKTMIETVDGLFMSGDEAHVELKEL